MMNRQKLLARISINPNICFGKPCIRGHRIWVSLILDFLASGMAIAELIGAEMSRDRYIDIPLVSA